jgi:hypothetical protein
MDYASHRFLQWLRPGRLFAGATFKAANFATPRASAVPRLPQCRAAIIVAAIVLSMVSPRTAFSQGATSMEQAADQWVDQIAGQSSDDFFSKIEKQVQINKNARDAAKGSLKSFLKKQITSRLIPPTHSQAMQDILDAIRSGINGQFQQGGFNQCQRAAMSQAWTQLGARPRVVVAFENVWLDSLQSAAGGEGVVTGIASKVAGAIRSQLENALDDYLKDYTLEEYTYVGGAPCMVQIRVVWLKSIGRFHFLVLGNCGCAAVPDDKGRLIQLAQWSIVGTGRAAWVGEAQERAESHKASPGSSLRGTPVVTSVHVKARCCHQGTPDNLSDPGQDPFQLSVNTPKPRPAQPQVPEAEPPTELPRPERLDQIPNMNADGLSQLISELHYWLDSGADIPPGYRPRLEKALDEAEKRINEIQKSSFPATGPQYGYAGAPAAPAGFAANPCRLNLASSFQNACFSLSGGISTSWAGLSSQFGGGTVERGAEETFAAKAPQQVNRLGFDVEGKVGVAGVFLPGGHGYLMADFAYASGSGSASGEATVGEDGVTQGGQTFLYHDTVFGNGIGASSPIYDGYSLSATAEVSNAWASGSLGYTEAFRPNGRGGPRLSFGVAVAASSFTQDYSASSGIYDLSDTVVSSQDTSAHAIDRYFGLKLSSSVSFPVAPEVSIGLNGYITPSAHSYDAEISQFTSYGSVSQELGASGHDFALLGGIGVQLNWRPAPNTTVTAYYNRSWIERTTQMMIPADPTEQPAWVDSGPSSADTLGVRLRYMFPPVGGFLAGAQGP